MREIRLPRSTWTFDETALLGPPGGFGAVYRGNGPTGEVVAVKHISAVTGDDGHREVDIAQMFLDAQFPHVLPVRDAGCDAETGDYFLVMELAERSLAQLLAERGPMPEVDAVPILHDIALGLAETPTLIHRDLKPGNVLFHAGAWKLGDFGLAKMVEASTSLRTLRDCLTPAYAAPEQWALEPSSKATDVYALGCICHALITGRPPFLGPDRADFQRQHLTEAPPDLDASANLRQFAALALRKRPETRPSVARVVRLLESAQAPPHQHGPDPIIHAGAAVARRHAEQEASAQAEAERLSRRRLVAQAAIAQFHELRDRLFQSILDAAPAAQRDSEGSVVLGEGRLVAVVRIPFVEERTFEHSRWDVIAGVLIGVQQNHPHYLGRSANLWYTDLAGDQGFRWYEVQYMTRGLSQGPEPFGFRNAADVRDADLAASNIVSGIQLAAQPVAVDDEAAEGFLRRWRARLAQAASSAMPMPGSLPETLE